MKRFFTLAFILVSFNIYSQNITNTLGTGGNFIIEDAANTDLISVSPTGDMQVIQGKLVVSDSLVVNGPITSSKIRTITATTTLGFDDQVIIANAGGAGFTINLPIAGIPIGKTYILKRVDSASPPANVLTVNGGVNNIDGANTYILPRTSRTYIKIIWDGTQWWIIGEGLGN